MSHFFLNETHKNLAAALHSEKLWELASDFPEVEQMLHHLDWIADMVDAARKEDKAEAFNLLQSCEEILKDLAEAVK